MPAINKEIRSNKQGVLWLVLEYFLSDKAYWLRFWFVILVVIGFVFWGALFENTFLLALRWGFIPVAVLLIAWIIGASYIQEIYELDSYKMCLNYLWASIFGFSLPTLTISDGKIDSSYDNENILTQIGGPGIISVKPGSAVILETLYGPSRILGAGDHRIFRFEIVKSAVSLGEQFGKIEEVPAVTRDGIDVKVKNVTYGFCVFRAHQEKTPDNPYPFEETGIHKMVYLRNIGPDGQLGSWADSVQAVIKSVIVGYIAKNDLDTLTAPNVLEGHPLDALRSELVANETQKSLENIGAQLEWHNIGSLSVDSAEVDLQRLDAWIVRQSGKAKILRAQGESENLASQERGRAEGQVALLKSIAQALQEINVSDEAGDARTYRNLRNIVLARTAQILESMTSIYTIPETKDGKDDSQK